MSINNIHLVLSFDTDYDRLNSYSILLNYVAGSLYSMAVSISSVFTSATNSSYLLVTEVSHRQGTSSAASVERCARAAHLGRRERSLERWFDRRRRCIDFGGGSLVALIGGADRRCCGGGSLLRGERRQPGQRCGPGLELAPWDAPLIALTAHVCPRFGAPRRQHSYCTPWP